MTHRKDDRTSAARLFTRRNALIGGAAATAGAVAAGGISAARRDGGGNPQVDEAGATAPLADAVVGFHGDRQAGITTPAPAYGNFIAVGLRAGLDRADVRRMLTVLTADAADLTAGLPPIADQEPELAEIPANLTVTVGFGERIFDIVDPTAKPEWLKPLPAFEQIDQLREEYNGGDLVLQICSDDRMTLAHAQRVLLKGLRSFGEVKWVQEGFRSASGSLKKGTTMRNLFGQVDGTINPTTEDSSMDEVVYGDLEGLEPWAPGGTSLVIRRIHMNLDTWDEADPPGREDAVGRRISDGAPLTGQHEDDPADLSATTALGFPVIGDYAHIRRASATTPLERILRRPYNYDLPVSAAGGLAARDSTSGGVSDSGLIFASYQADPVRQFLPIQRRLAELDMLNRWTVPIGSAVFAVPPGCAPGGFLGDLLFEG